MSVQDSAIRQGTHQLDVADVRVNRHVVVRCTAFSGRQAKSASRGGDMHRHGPQSGYAFAARTVRSSSPTKVTTAEMSVMMVMALFIENVFLLSQQLGLTGGQVHTKALTPSLG